MMKLVRIVMNYVRFKEAKLIALCNKIQTSMTDNPYFPNLEAVFTVFLNKFEAYKAANVTGNNEINDAEKEARRMELIQAMNTLAYRILADAQNNRTVLETTGFSLNAIPTKRPVPNTPENVKAFITNSPKTIVVSCKADKNASIYKARVSEDRENWQWDNESTSCKVIVENVSEGVILYVEMALKNSSGESRWSDPVAVRVPMPNEPELMKMNI